jgi:hypothetical protein
MKGSPKRGKFEINGSSMKVNQGVNVFYLPLKQKHVVKIGEKSYELYYEVCKIISLRMN